MVRLPSTGRLPVPTDIASQSPQRSRSTSGVSQTSQVGNVAQVQQRGVSGQFPAGPVQTSGDLTATKSELKAELQALESEARSLTAEAEKIRQQGAELTQEVGRLSGIVRGLAEARTNEVGNLKTAKTVRRDEYEKAKAKLDEKLTKLRELGVPESEVQTARRNILMRLARSAVRTGSPNRYKADPKREDFGGELERLKSVASKKVSPTKVAHVMSGLAQTLAHKRDEIGQKQRVVGATRSAIEACDRKTATVSEKIETHKKTISSGKRRLTEIKPRLDAINQRIAELKTAISLLEMLSDQIKAEEETSQRRHEQAMKQADQAQDDERLQAIKKTREQLEASLRAAAKEQAQTQQDTQTKSAQTARVTGLKKAITDIQGAAQRPGAQASEIRKALVALEQLMKAAAAEESVMPLHQRTLAKELAGT